jgi:hypothetical protein
MSEIYLQIVGFNCSEASAACVAKGMRLFQMTSPEAANALFVCLVLKTGYDAGTYWVDGLLSTECQAVYNTDGSFDTTSSNCSNKMFSFCEKVNVERGL